MTVRPSLEHPPPVFVLATGAGIGVAGDAGLPVVIGGPVLSDPALPELLADYRARVSATGGTPHVVVSVDVLVADSAADARALAVPEAWALARARTSGEFPALEPSDPHRPLTERQRRVVDTAIGRTVYGDEASVRDQLAELFHRTDADELLASTSTFDLTALEASDSRLASLFS